MYIVGLDDVPERICFTRADAEEYVLAYAEEEAYESYYDDPHISYLQALKYASQSLWIQEVECY